MLHNSKFESKMRDEDEFSNSFQKEISECCSECCKTQHYHTQHTGFKHGINFHSEQERKWKTKKKS
jgi:hypothetical protein